MPKTMNPRFDFPQMVTAQAIARAVVNPLGNIFYVNSAKGSDRSDGVRFNHPLKTLKQAIANAQADDNILISPGHIETVTAANGINFPATKPRIAVVGLGNGRQKPQITFTTATAVDIQVGAAGITLRNLELICGIDNLASYITCDAPDAVFEDLFVRHDTAFQVLNAITLSANALNCRIERLTARQAAAAAASCIQVTGHATNLHNLIVRDCDIAGDYSVGCINNPTTAMLNMTIERNAMQNLNAADPCIALQAAATGWISYNRFRNTQIDASDLVITGGTAVQLCENYVVNLDRETGKLVGTVSG